MLRHLGRRLQKGNVAILVVMMMILAEETVQASPMQVCSFSANQPLSNQRLVIKNMDDRSVVCTFYFTTAPYSVNCKEPETHVCVKNESYVEMFTDGQKKVMMEYGSGKDLNGHNLDATCEDSPPQPRCDDGSNNTMGIILGVLLVVAVLLAIFLCIMYIFGKRFRSWVKETFPCLRGSNMWSGTKTGTNSNANARSSPNEGDVSVIKTEATAHLLICSS